jgi:hypothetical protein
MTEKSGSNKDVIYIDVDDEITGIIDKVRGSHSKIVALVLPKRATVLQSVVNMKLLKRSSDEAKKHLVLITSEAGLLPLAGSVGIHVAKSLQSKPEIPDGPDSADSGPEEVDEDSDDDEDEDTAPAQSSVAARLRGEDKPVDKTKPVGELAGAAAIEDTIELDDDDGDAEADEDLPTAGAAAKPKKGTDKKLRIPNFNKFRVILMLSGLAVIVLIVFGYFALSVMPKAKINIKTDSQALTSSTIINLKTDPTTKLDAKQGTLLAKAQVVQKTVTQQVNSTGTQNNGAQATGTMTLVNCSDSSISIPKGTAFSSSGKAFLSNVSISVPASNFTSPGSGSKCKNDGKATVDVTSQRGGADNNLAAANYSIGGYPSTLSASGSAMTGGTDDISKIVLQADIDSATQKIAAADTTPIKEELKTDLTNVSQYAIVDTFTTGTPETKTSANVGDKADSVTVTQTIKYTMLGVNKDDLKKIIAEDVNTKIDPTKQSILDYGIDGAVFGVQGTPDGGATLTMQTDVVAGPDLHTDDLKKAVAGKKAGDAKEIIKQNPGVKEVEVTYSPFWVSSIPGKTSKITITIEKPQAAKTNSSNDTSSNP